MPYPDLLAATAAWLTTDPALLATFSGRFVLGRAGTAQIFPYGRLAWRKPQPTLSLDDEPLAVTLSAYATDADAAAEAGELFAARFLDEARTPLEFTDARGRSWRESARVEGEAEGPDMADIVAAVAGGDEGYVWRWRQPFDVWVVRTA